MAERQRQKYLPCNEVFTQPHPQQKHPPPQIGNPPPSDKMFTNPISPSVLKHFTPPLRLETKNMKM